MKHTILILVAILVVLGLFIGYPIVKKYAGGVPAILSPSPELPDSGEPLPFTLADGFTANIFSRDVPGARVLTRAPDGVLVASLTNEGKIVALPDFDGNGEADSVEVILEKLNSPHGIQFRCGPLGEVTDYSEECYLFVAEEDKVSVYAYDSKKHTAVFVKKLIDLPSGNGHSTRSLYLHPDGKNLLVSVGSSCNVCHENDEKRASILAVDMKSGIYSVFAKGLRNTVFFTPNPVTGEFWGTDMGRDLLGDDTPPDEVNILSPSASSGQNSIPNFGWPICYGKNIHDTEFDKNTYIRNPCMEPFETPSYIDIPAHSAPLGIAFIPEEGWPDGYGLSALVALHGSWNRSTPAGYKIVRYPIDGKGNPLAPVDFMTGFMADGKILGRPVALLAEPGGVLYVSDDRAGVVYRVTSDR